MSMSLEVCVKEEGAKDRRNLKLFLDRAMSMALRDLANVRLIYNPFFEKKLTAEQEYQHVGPYYMDDGNTKKHGGYDVLNFRAEYRLNDNFRIFGKIYNLTDRLYAETANIAYGRERYRPGMPRTLYVGVDMVW